MNLGDEQIPDPECHKILQDNEICLGKCLLWAKSSLCVQEPVLKVFDV